MWMALCAVLAVLLVGVLLMKKLRAGDKAPAVGTPAPDFTLNSQEGKPISLHDFKGKWVVLYFYPKDMTSGCTIEAHNFQRDLAKYEAKNAVILGISMQGEKSHREFCAKESLTFKLLADQIVTMRSPKDLDALDLGVGGPGQDRLEHLLSVRRRGVVHDQQRLAHGCACMVTAVFMASRARRRSPA